LFVSPNPPANESERLAFLHSCGILDTPEDERFDRLTRLATRYFDAETAFIGFIDAERQWLKSSNSPDLEVNVKRENSFCNLMITSGEPLVVGDLRTDPRLRENPIAQELPLRFYAGAPLLTSTGLAIGSLCVLKREPGDPAAFDLRSLVDFAEIAMSEVELWKRNYELTQLAQTDALTSLANRRSFDIAMERAVRQMRRVGQPLSVMLIDLDHFKALNDTLGHQAGDQVLQQFAKILSGVARRPEDSVARYGGEEFAIILPSVDAEGAREVAASLCASLREARITHPGAPSGIMTASIGIASAPASAVPEVRTLLSQADAALYAAKHAGRDRFILHE
jgi:diguanylate cyclase (GGDEF)-like protein